MLPLRLRGKHLLGLNTILPNRPSVIVFFPTTGRVCALNYERLWLRNYTAAVARIFIEEEGESSTLHHETIPPLRPPHYHIQDQ